jgi:hypothetical protein
MRYFRTVLLIGCLVILLTACQTAGIGKQEFFTSPSITHIPQTPTAALTSIPTAAITPTPLPVILVGAGDISICGQKGDDLTADLLADIPGTIFTVGDNSNENGTEYEYLNCFGPSWGRFLDRLRPVPGNHDYVIDNARPYFNYFSDTPVTPGRGYYSYDLGSWHIIALNSVINISDNSLQLQWLREDLASHQSPCTLAYWHNPRWTSGESGNSGRVTALWQTLYESGVDVVVNGNEHMYERFAPMDPTGALDLAQGIREFIAGTGGASHYRIGEIQPNSQVRDNTAFGVLKFKLYLDSYDWEFIPVAGIGFTDSGSDFCHR